MPPVIRGRAASLNIAQSILHTTQSTRARSLSLLPRTLVSPIRYTTAVMPHSLALAVELITTVLAVAGMGYFLTALVAARAFIAARRKPLATFAPGVSILKSLKGLDPEMLAAFRSHCRQTYAGEFEMLFGVA